MDTVSVEKFLLSISIRTAKGETPIDGAKDWQVSLTEQSMPGTKKQIRLRANWHGHEPTQARLVVHVADYQDESANAPLLTVAPGQALELTVEYSIQNVGENGGEQTGKGLKQPWNFHVLKVEHRPAQEPAIQPIASDGPHPVRLLPGLYQVGGGLLSHPRDASSYLLMDESNGECLMVDCGSHTGFNAVHNNILQIADLKQIQIVIGTHCHWDHVEAFNHLRQETGARFAIHELDAQAVRNGDPDLTCAGFLYNEPFHPFPVDLELKGGEHLQIGYFDLEILHLPGHSPGCIGVLATHTLYDLRLLIPGDSVSGGFSQRCRSDITAWKQSMQRLMAERIDFMLPSHMPGGSQTSLLADVPNRLARVYSQLETDFHAFMDHQWS